MSTFTARVKDEITLSKLNEIENRNLFLGYLYANGEWTMDKITLSLENLSVAQKLFKTLKYCYHLNPKMTVRTQKRFIMTRLFIFEIDDSSKMFAHEIDNIPYMDEEDEKSFIKGIFLATGSINDPTKRGYHLEITFESEEKGKRVLAILNKHGYSFKMIKREKNYMLYLKSSEEISDFLKLLGAVNALFHYEDIRIYRDHKNMVNRLNNCEQANYEKSFNTSKKQLEVIEFLKNGDYFSLLDEKTILVAEYRLKYPEESFQSLADIISTETDKKVTKSYINHHFRKINEVYDRVIKSLEQE